jgi:hypothetical protein
MKFINHIKAYTMLLIMLFMMMHNAFPHVHHQHDVNSAAISEGEFHHHGPHAGHHHHSEEEEENKDHNQKSFLEFLINNHSHSQHTHQYTSAIVKLVKSVKQLDSRVFVNNDNWNLKFLCVNFGLHRYVLFKNFVPEHLYLNSHPHRGPPILG